MTAISDKPYPFDWLIRRREPRMSLDRERYARATKAILNANWARCAATGDVLPNDVPIKHWAGWPYAFEWFDDLNWATFKRREVGPAMFSALSAGDDAERAIKAATW